jgi:beta-N-acetylhexosaminidase
MAGFTHEQLAGQRLMIGFDGIALNSDLKFYIDTLKVGGIILFSRNIKDVQQLKSLCQSAQDYAGACGQPPLFIAIDQEGGQVARLQKPFTVFPGNPFITTRAEARRFAEITATELKQVGINMNMAPVLDVAPKEIDSIMAGRVFGHDPGQVSLLGTEVVRGMQQNGILSVGKHFPGIGRTVIDSHLDLPSLDVTPEDLAAMDLLPFQAAIADNVAGIMLSHIHYPKLDPKWPASLSPAIARNLLRYKLGFDGLVLTDDLDMGAIKKHYPIYDAVEQILKAEIDIVLICHKGPDIKTAFEEILRQADHSGIMAEKGEKAVERILGAKGRVKLNSEN